MAKDNERPQFNPRHRIAGAIILVSLAVIFVPMLLDDSAPPKTNQTLSDIPTRDAAVSETKVVVTPIPALESPKTQIATADPVPEKSALDKPTPESTPTPKTETTKTETKPAVVAAVEKKNDATTAKSRPVVAKTNGHAEKLNKGWIVQVGTFASTENAERLRDKLKTQGYAVSSESVTVQGNKALRLRVGPYPDKPAATKAQAQLQKELSIQGMVLAYP